MRPSKKTTLFKNKAFRLTPYGLRQGDLRAELTEPGCLQITQGDHTRSVAIPTSVPQGCIGYRGELPILSAVYNLAIHELQSSITAEGVLTAGAAWSTVWTRDIAYAAALGTNLAAPEATRRSLAARVRDGIILQDTGTGGGWPISTDRVVWALGAWAYYQSSGDKEWLEFSISALCNTLAQDAKVLRTSTIVPLIPGETSFLDWRDQSYPDWMSTAEIGASYAFSTNVLHYMARRLLARMLKEAGRSAEAEPYARQAAALAKAINDNFRLSPLRYAMMLTPNGTPENRVDALATALAVLSGLTVDNAEQIMRNLPRTAFGTPVFSPFKSQTPQSYHNRAIWPFVEAFVLLAHAELQDLPGVEFSMAALLRAALAFGTNKENLHATTGAAHSTVQNSDSQLWSIAGILGLFYHGLLGIQYEHDNLVFAPNIPEKYAGSHWFTGLKIRNMVLDVHLNGYGTEICSVMINGKPGAPLIPLDTQGHLQIELELMPVDSPAEQVNWIPAQEDIPAPEWAECDDKHLTWNRVSGATKYQVYANSYARRATNKTSIGLLRTPRTACKEFYLRAFKGDCSSPLSKPHTQLEAGARSILHPCHIGEHGEYPVENRQAWLDTRPCTSNLIYQTTENLPAGLYQVRILYANATASLRDGDTCALRELRVNDRRISIIPLPHNTEAEHWENYSYTAPVTVKLSGGAHTFSLHYTPDCTNANQHINQCMVRHLELTYLGRPLRPSYLAQHSGFNAGVNDTAE